jgi:hypothetical protein
LFSNLFASCSNQRDPQWDAVELTQVWMGARGVTTHTHYDIFHSMFLFHYYHSSNPSWSSLLYLLVRVVDFYVQIYGQKKFTLSYPGNARALYLYPVTHARYRQSQLDFTKPPPSDRPMSDAARKVYMRQYRASRPLPTDENDRMTELSIEQQEEERLMPDAWWSTFDKWEQAEAITTVLQPGEMLYVIITLVCTFVRLLLVVD